MDFKKFETEITKADNDSLLRSLVEHAKKMDDNLDYYEAVKLIKNELLERLKNSSY